MELTVDIVAAPTPAQITDIAALLHDLVANGAALGWTTPPATDEVAALVAAVVDEARAGDAALALASDGGRVVGVGYWRRYTRPTHRPHADIEKIAVARDHRGHGLGRRLMQTLVGAARDAGVEQLTLDLRADNAAAVALYESLGFRRYGRLDDFVAVGERRYGKLFYVLDLRRPPD